jgi:hypothetical protein
MSDKKDFIQGVHYYLEGDRIIFTALFHLERGECCQNYCRHCPFDPRHKKGNQIINEEFGYLRKSN